MITSYKILAENKEKDFVVLSDGHRFLTSVWDRAKEWMEEHPKSVEKSTKRSFKRLVKISSKKQLASLFGREIKTWDLNKILVKHYGPKAFKKFLRTFKKEGGPTNLSERYVYLRYLNGPDNDYFC